MNVVFEIFTGKWELFDQVKIDYISLSLGSSEVEYVNMHHTKVFLKKYPNKL